MKIFAAIAALLLLVGCVSGTSSYYRRYSNYDSSGPSDATISATRTRDLRIGRRTSGSVYSSQTSTGCISGSCRSGVVESDTSNWPLQHHVDFNERNPGEDLLALESGGQLMSSSSRSSMSSSGMSASSSRRQASMASMSSSSSSWPASRVSSVSSSSSSYSSTGLRSGAAVAVVCVPAHMICMTASMSTISSNVCINREEQDESDRRQTVRVDTVVEDSLSGQPVMTMRTSTCEDVDGKYTCTNQVTGPGVKKTISTTYECCSGYTISANREGCVRGRSDTLFSTIEVVGSVEFKKLCQSAGLSRKLESETLTLFVPADVALKSFIAENSIRTGAIAQTQTIEETSQRRNLVFQRTVSEGDSQFAYRRRSCTYTRAGCSSSVSRVEQELERTFQELGDWKASVMVERDEFARESGSRNTGRGDITVTEDVKDSLLSHIVPGRITTTEITEERTVYTENRQSVMRMETFNVGQERINTVNCARLISTNHECTNGVIHIVDRVLRPVTMTLEEIIATDARLSIFRTWLHSAQMLDILRDSRQRYTIFVPSDAAIRALGEEFLLRMQRRGPCLRRMLQHHIVPLTFCSSIVVAKGEIRNMNQVVMSLVRNSEDKLYIDGSEVVVRDIVGTNGVIHVIDRVLMAETEEPLAFALEKAGLTSFVRAVERSRLSLQDYANVTIFAPTNAAFESLSQEIMTNQMKLREILQYHIATTHYKACHFTHQQQITTQLGRSNNIRINLYANFPVGTDAEITAQCGRVTRINYNACNGIIHTVDRVLIPSTMDIIDTLRTQSDFSIFTRLITEYGMTETLRSAGPYTIFAPKDIAFYALPRDTFDTILSSSTEALKVLRAHIIPDSLCCSGILPSVWFLGKRVETLGGEKVPLSRDASGKVTFGRSLVTSCDLTAANGIIHTVDTVYVQEVQRMEYTVMRTCVPTRGKLETTDITSLFFRA